MTLLTDPPAPRIPTGAAPVPRRRGVRSAAPPLLRAVAAAIASLDDVDDQTLTVRRRIDRMLRDAVETHLARAGDDPVPAVPAVRVACAHLAVGDLEDAYLALLTARDLLR